MKQSLKPLAFTLAYHITLYTVLKLIVTHYNAEVTFFIILFILFLFHSIRSQNNCHIILCYYSTNKPYKAIGNEIYDCVR